MFYAKELVACCPFALCSFRLRALHGRFFTSFGPVEQMGEVAWGAHVEVCCDPGDRDGGLLAECLSDFDFDRIAFGGGAEGALGPAVFAKEGFEESTSALFFAFLNFVAVMGRSANVGDEFEDFVFELVFAEEPAASKGFVVALFFVGAPFFHVLVELAAADAGFGSQMEFAEEAVGAQPGRALARGFEVMGVAAPTID